MHTEPDRDFFLLAAMTYVEFKAELRRAKMTVKELAAVLGMNPISITNYKAVGEVPRHLAVIVTLLAALAERGVAVDALFETKS